MYFQVKKCVHNNFRQLKIMWQPWQIFIQGEKNKDDSDRRRTRQSFDQSKIKMLKSF
jgi:hypothetical protein